MLVAVIGLGSVMLIDVWDEQPLASVTTYKYDPAVSLKLPVPEYGCVPPTAKTVTVELFPLHKIAVEEEDAVNGAGSETVIVVFAIFP